jgi:molecular chaperone DnaK (HSP70)
MAKMQSVGIDLGTTNCALALTRREGTEAFTIAQLVGAGRVGDERTFASALYVPAEGQFPEGSLTLPWTEKNPPFILGNFARDIGAQVPDRLITSAKSWLNHRSVDPRKPLLPWKSELVEQKRSPMEATRLYLEHLRAAFDYECEKRGITAPFQDTQTVLTVPASFDDAARKITAQSAIDAGWGDEAVLLEEPQAAFYAWLGAVGGNWREHVEAGDIILICDVGGGTSDFSLIAVSQREGNLELDRISVGRHILLGGDNMDLALAHALRRQLVGEEKQLDDRQFPALIHASRMAKERLFEDGGLNHIDVAVPSSGSSLLAGTVATKLTRETLEEVTVDGFFAATPVSEMPREAAGIGLQEFGLSYAADPVISKHLAEFLVKSLKNVRANKALAKTVGGGKERLSGQFLRPDAVLFNGGVFKAAPLRARVIELLRSWAEGAEVRELEGADFDLAVAKGASVYGYTKVSGKGIRIRAGVARSYYLGLEPSMPAIPGFTPPLKAVCVAQQGMEEGEERILEERVFGLVTGATVRFRFFRASDRAGDTVGTMIENAEKELEETTSLEMTLPEMEGGEEKMTIPVRLHSRLSELGVLQLWMQHTLSEKRWELNFSVRTE